MSEPILRIEDLQVDFGGSTAVDGVSFDVGDALLLRRLQLAEVVLLTPGDGVGVEVVTDGDILRVVGHPRARQVPGAAAVLTEEVRSLTVGRRTSQERDSTQAYNHTKPDKLILPHKTSHSRNTEKQKWQTTLSMIDETLKKARAI